MRFPPLLPVTLTATAAVMLSGCSGQSAANPNELAAANSAADRAEAAAKRAEKAASSVRSAPHAASAPVYDEPVEPEPVADDSGAEGGPERGPESG